MENWDSDIKNTIRKKICKKKGKSYVNVLLLPSDTCLDVEEMIKSGAINPKTTFVTAVEKVGFMAKNMEKRLKELKLTKFEVLTSSLEDVKLTKKYDFVYLDTCNQLNEGLINWLCTQSQLKLFSNTIVVAFSHYIRNGSKLLSNFEKFVTKEKISKVRVAPKLHNIDSEIQLNQHQHMAMILRGILGDAKESIIYMNKESHTPMHVFTFKARAQAQGMSKIIKFLTLHTKQEPKILSAGLKAASKRFKIEEKPAKVEKVSYKGLIETLMRRIEALEGSKKQKKVSNRGAGEKVYTYIKEKKSNTVPTIDEVAKNLNVSSNTALKAFTRLVSEGYIKKTPFFKGYQLTNPIYVDKIPSTQISRAYNCIKEQLVQDQKINMRELGTKFKAGGCGSIQKITKRLVSEGLIKREGVKGSYHYIAV